MIKLILVNVLLFLLCMVLFVAAAVGISYAMGTRPADVEVALAYIAVVCLHLFINYRLMVKWQLATMRRKVVSTILIILAYIFYHYIYYLHH